tara:strand:- start:372 stop:722 length:351 start_codon:yes stop_codon:yes gene_type:complete
MTTHKKAILVTGTECILIVDVETGYVVDKRTHNARTCELSTKEHRRKGGCQCSDVEGLNTAYSDVRRFNLNDRTKDLVSGEIDILHIGYETWQGDYERPLTEFIGVDTMGYITSGE